MACCERALFELHFDPLGANRHACDVPCDAAGCVDIDGLDEQARNRYLYARAVVGREFAKPIVRSASA